MFRISDRPPLVNRAAELFAQQHQTICEHADRLFSGLLVVQYLVGIALALWYSPVAWAGDQSTVHSHVWVAFFLGAAIISLPVALGIFVPGIALTRHLIAMSQMLMGALLIHLTGGRLETHFHVFGSLALLGVYRDWRVLVSASAVVAADHFFRGLWWPRSVYGVNVVEEWRWLEHSIWVFFEDIFLIYYCLRGTQEMMTIAFRHAELEETNTRIEQTVELRTLDLNRTTAELQQRVSLTELSAEIGVAIAAGENLRPILQTCCQSIVQHLDTAVARIWTLNQAENCLELVASAGLSTALDGAHERIAVGQDQIGLIAQEKAPFVTNAVVEDLSVHDSAWGKREELVAFAGYPLMVGSRAVGVVALFARQAFAEITTRALSGAADMLAICIERMRSQQRLNEQTAELIRVNEELNVQINARTQAEYELSYQTTLLETVLQSMGGAVVAVDNTGQFLVFNRAAERILGYGAAKCAPSDWTEHYGCYLMDTVTPFPPQQLPLARAMAGEIVEETELFIRNALIRKGRYITASARPFTLENGARGGVVVFHDCTERKQAEVELRRRERELADFIENATLGMQWVAPTGIILWANHAVLDLLGYTQTEYVGHYVGEFYVNESEFANISGLVLKCQSLRDYEVQLKCKDGTTKTVLIDAAAFQENGVYTHRRCFVRDISDRKRAEQTMQNSLREKEALLKEIHHRVKNNLQIVSSLLNLQLPKIKDPEAFAAFQDSQNRVRSMALIHETLYRSGDLAGIGLARYVNTLCDNLVRSYGVDSSRIQLKVNVSDTPLDLERAIPCGLIINELVSNALKYAFPKGNSGRIAVELMPQSDATYSLVVSDTGIGLPTGLDLAQLDSLGLNLVNDLAGQIGGSLRIESCKGATFRINFPMAI